MPLGTPCLAAITLNANGGGVAAVSRLMWRVFEERWPGKSRLITLLDDNTAAVSVTSSTATRLRFGTQMARVQAVQHCDWIMYGHLSVAKVQAFVPPAWQRPYAVFIHGVEIWRPLSDAEKRVLRAASLRVANSRFTAARVREMHPDIGDVAACPLTIPPVQHGGAVPISTRQFDIGRRAVLVVARLAANERYKGHDELLESWPLVARHVPDARLVFAGKGDDAARLEAKARELGLGGQVLFTGFVSDHELHRLYREAAVFAMPSRNEGFGLVYLEAMSHGLPCVGALDDAASEIILDGTTGFLVRQSDREGLADRLVRLLTDEPLRTELGGRGRQRALQEFGYERFASNLVTLLQSAFEPRLVSDRRTAAAS